MTAGPYRVVLHGDGRVAVFQRRSRRVLRGRLGWRLPPGFALEVRPVAVLQAGRHYTVLHLLARVGHAGRAGAATWEAALWLRGRTLVKAWAGATGAQGPDHAWSRHLRVSKRGILVFQRTRFLSRCDGLAARMLSRGYHFASRRLLPVLLTAPRLKGAVAIIARRVAPQGVRRRPLVPFRFDSASSEVGCGGHADAVTPPSELHDGRPTTAWIEGQGGPGQWEYATAHAVGTAPRVRAIRILPGHGGRGAAYNRLKVAWLLLGPKERFRVTFPQDPLQAGRVEPWWVVLPRPLAARCLTLVIEQVYPGKSGDTAVGEVSVFSEADFGDPVARTLRDVTAGRMDREEAIRRLSRLDVTDMPRLRRVLPKTASPAAQEVVLRVLARRDAMHSAAALAKAVPTAAPGLAKVLLGALVKLGDAGVSVLGKLLADARRPRLAGEVARALVRVGTVRAVQGLLARLGRGGRAVRGALVAALVGAPRATLRPALLDALDRPGRAGARQADLLLLAHRVIRGAPSLGQALAARLAAHFGAYRSVEARIRLLDLAGRLASPRLLGPLTALVGGNGDPILRERAVRALAGYPGDQARQSIAEALRAASPRVRRGAVWAWGRTTERRSAGVVEALAERDPWPMVREAALRALGRRCLPSSFAALIRVARRRGSRRLEGLRRVALVGLLGCHAPASRKVLGAILTDDHDRVSMRRLVIRILGHRRDRGYLSYLIEFLDLLARKVTRARGSNEALAADLAEAIGNIGDPRGAAVLARAAGVDRLPRLRASALTALSHFCGVGVARGAVRRALAGSRSRLVLGAARRTASRCGYPR